MIILQMTQLWPPAAIPHVSLLAVCVRSCAVPRASPGTTRPSRGAGGLCAQLPVALQDPHHPPCLCSTGTYS